MSGVQLLVRSVLLASASVLAGSLGAENSQSAGLVTKGQSGWVDYSLHYSGFPIGNHRITYRHEGEDLILTYDTNVSLSIAFITIAKYTQSIRQTWRNGRLQSLDAHTDDGDNVSDVHARAAREGLMVDGPNGSFVAPANTVPTFYWEPGLLGATRILDIEKGKLINVKFERSSAETISVEGRDVPADVIRVSGDKTAEFAWTRENEIVLREVVTKGRRIAFVREASGVQPTQAAQAPAPRR